MTDAPETPRRTRPAVARAAAWTLAALAAVVAAVATCGPSDKPLPPPPNPQAAAGGPAKPGTSGPIIEPQRTYDLTTVPAFTYVTQGSGRELRRGDLVEMHYVGTLPDGRTFDSSRARDEPFTFELGAGHVILGWELVVAKLRIGDRITVTLRSDLAYGDRGGPGGIGSRTPVTYDIEVLRVVEPPKWEVLQKGDGLPVTPGRTVLAHHVGTFADGTEYRNTRKTGVPTRFKAGIGEQIESWDRVIVGMRVGDRWKISSPWVFAFGAEGRARNQPAKIEPVPPKTDLVDDVEILAVSDAPTLKKFVKRGRGAAVADDKRVTVRFTARVARGDVVEDAIVDSSAARGEPFVWTMRSKDAVDGWAEFFPFLHEGDRVEVLVPWVWAYGLDGHGMGEGDLGKPPKVPPRTDLLYDIEVLSVD